MENVIKIIDMPGADYIRLARHELRLSIKELAEEVEINPNTLQRIEAGKDCNYYTFCRIIIYFNNILRSRK